MRDDQTKITCQKESISKTVTLKENISEIVIF